MANINNGIKVGSEVKCEILWSLPEPHTLDSIDWSIEVTLGAKKVTFAKSECIRHDDGKWYCIVPTTELGAGNYGVTAHYRIPDADEHHDQIREMIVGNSTNIQINRR